MKKAILIIAIVIFYLNGYAQHRIGDFMAYGSTDGLPASFYNAVVQSSDGYLWIGSSSGLVRFDGKNYKTFFSDYADTNSLSDNVISDLIEDDAQNLWIAGLYQGLTKLNLRTGHMQRYSRLSQDKTYEYGINRLFKDEQGQIWVGTSGRGLAHYLPAADSFEFFVPDPLKPFDGSDVNNNHISGIAADKSDENVLWLSSFDGLYAFNKTEKTFQRYFVPHPDWEDQALQFLCVEADGGNKVWLGTWYGGLMSFDKVTHQFQRYVYPLTEPPNSTHYVVLDIKSVNDSTLYLATRNTGLVRFHTSSAAMDPLLTNTQLPDGSSSIDIQRISITPNAGVFVGGNYYIYQQHPSFDRFSQSVSFPYGSHFGVWEIVYDQSRMGYWAACQNAGEMVFFKRDMSARKVYQTENVLDDQFVDLAIDQKQRVWVVTPSLRLLVFDEDDGIFRRATDEFPGIDTLARQVNEIESDHDGNLWLVTQKKLFYADVGANTVKDFALVNNAQDVINDINLRNGSNQDVWISSSSGLFHYLPDRNKVIQLVPDDKRRNGIANLYIKAMTIDRAGNAWLGYESDGVQVVSGIDHSILSTYNLNDGLPAMQVNFMATDSAGGIWAGTGAGLAYFNPGSDAGVWQLFNREDGVRRDYIDRQINGTSDGKLFFNIEAGLSWIDIGVDQAIPKDVPLLHLITCNVDGKPYRSDLLPDYLKSVELPYDVNEISIEYAAMDWLHPGRTRYFYRIDGINPEGEWIENRQAQILLTGMKPGSYQVRLYAVSGDGIKSKVIALPILIRPPFWYKWWFIVACAFSFVLIGYALYQYRIGQLKKLQAMRNSISTNLHDDIGASLSNIHILTVLTQRNIANPANATTYIAKAGDEIQQISEALSDIVWNINPKYDDLDNLFVRMKRYAADMMDGKEIAAELVFPEAMDKLTMPMDQRRDFYLIFKEAVNNLVKYSDATEASVRVMINHKMIRMEVWDNGKGFDMANVHTGNGMQNMKQRAEKWKAMLVVQSEVGSGTRILLEMKVG